MTLPLLSMTSTGATRSSSMLPLSTISRRAFRSPSDFSSPLSNAAPLRAVLRCALVMPCSACTVTLAP